MRRIFLLSIALCLFVSCMEKWEQPVTATETGEGDEVLFRYTISGKGLLTRMTMNGPDGSPSFEKGDKVGIYMIPHQGGGDPDLGGPTYPSAKNVPYLYDPDNYDFDPKTSEPHTEPILVAADENRKIVYAGNPVNFVSYWPYDADAVKNGHKVPVDVQTNECPLPNMSLLYANGVGIPKKKFEIMDFEYKTPLCKLTMTATLEGGNDFDLTDAKLTVKGMPTTADFNLCTGKMENWEGTEEEVEMELNEDASNANTASWETLVIPHTENDAHEDGRIFTFTFMDGPYEWKHIFYLPTDFEFESGESYEFNYNVVKRATALDGKSNCYMVKPGEKITFKIARAYKDEGESSVLHVDDTTEGTPESYGDDVATERFEADVIWDDADVIRSINVRNTGPDAELTVITDNIKKLPGNAVVKVYKKGDAAKFPVWSYHIWVTDPDNVQAWTNPTNNAVLMDRNLGATEAALSYAGHGLLYQWGRKDPFPGCIAGTAGYAALKNFMGMPDSKVPGPFTITAASADEGVIESIKYPNRFFSAIDIGIGLNWLPEKKVNLWYNDGNKTIYDPCPPSWMTMLGKSNPRALGTLVSWNTSGNPDLGWNTTGPTAGTILYPSDPIIFPAAGFRSENDGSVAPSFWGHSRVHGGESIPIENQFHGSMYWFQGYYGLIETLCPIGQAISIRCVKQTQ